MLDAVHTTMTASQIEEIGKRPIEVCAKTKTEQLKQAKAALERGDQSYRDVAKALVLAKNHYKATGREMAHAVGRSVGWVNGLLK
jgi:hypothetical protein